MEIQGLNQQLNMIWAELKWISNELALINSKLRGLEYEHSAGPRQQQLPGLGIPPGGADRKDRDPPGGTQGAARGEPPARPRG